MFELLSLIVFCWLTLKVIGLGLRVTWGLAKFAAAALFVLAFPALIGALVLAGGMALLIPIGLIAGAFGILRSCV